MNLGNIFSNDNLHHGNVVSDNTQNAESVIRAEKSARVTEMLESMYPGKTIQGEVLSVDGNSVSIEVANKMILNARLSQNIILESGQKLNFEVKSNNGSQLIITPLFANLDNEATILKALTAAGLKDTPKNLDMISKMMNEGMPIDKESIINMNRLMATFPGAESESVVQMKRLGLPLTENTIEQFGQYKNNEYQITNSIHTITEDMQNLLSEETVNNGLDHTLDLYTKLLDVFSENDNLVQDNIQTSNIEGMSSSNVTDASKQMISDQIGGAEPATDLISSESNQSVKSTHTLVNDGQNPYIDSEILQNNLLESQKSKMQIRSDSNQQAETLTKEESLTEQIKNELNDKLESLAKNGQVKTNDLLQLLQDIKMQYNALSTSDRIILNQHVAKLLQSKEFGGLLKDIMAKQWTLEPEKGLDAQKVEHLYEKIREQTGKLEEVLQNAGKMDSPIAKSVDNLNQNIDFMNQLNHLFTYVQLPLKMSGNEAHGDLYVYTNKKNLAKQDGNVSAFLHLDMSHLGPVDVYVSMSKNNVNTNFTLRDEAAIDLLEANIHILNERLEKRGYSLSSSIHKKENQMNDDANIVMNQILNQNKNISILSRTSFDMRA